MSERDVKLLADGLSTLADEGFEAMMPLVHPEFEMTTPPEMAAEPQTYRGAEGQTYRGAEGLRLWWESFYEVMDEVRLEPARIVDGGDGVVIVDMQLRATGQSSGLEVSQHAVMLVRLRDELMHRVEMFATIDEALAAVG